MIRATTIFLLALGAAGCATSFQGSAKFPGGPKGCYDRCSEAGMQMASFVYVGEYSTGCVCSLKDRDGGEASAQRGASENAATAAAAVGVMTQMRAQQQQAAQHRQMQVVGVP
jgi:hypothetical protein